MILRTMLLAVAFVTAAHAGTPLICHPYAIGNAKTLGGDGDPWSQQSRAGERRNLVADTLALLTPEMPVIVRMETMRRAVIYATNGKRAMPGEIQLQGEDEALVSSLVRELRARLEHPKDKAIALFDYGFFVETLRHMGVDRGIEGYDFLTQAATLRGNDPDVEFALALAASWPRQRPERDQHLAKARAGAKPNSLLATNLAALFSGS